MSQYDKTVKRMHVTRNGGDAPSLAEVQKPEYRLGRTAIEFVCMFEPGSSTVVVGSYQKRQRPACVFDAQQLFNKFDDKALGELMVEILNPTSRRVNESLQQDADTYSALGSNLRDAMKKAEACGTVIVWLREEGDKVTCRVEELN